MKDNIHLYSKFFSNYTINIYKAFWYSMHCQQKKTTFTSTACISSASRMSHTCICLPSHSWYSSTDPEGWKAEWTLLQSSPGQDTNLQPPDYKS